MMNHYINTSIYLDQSVEAMEMHQQGFFSDNDGIEMEGN